MFLGLIWSVATLPAVTASPDPSLTLWYEKPTTEYMSGLPLGNGRIGAMVLGEPSRERIALNHQFLWRGKTRDRKNPVTAQNLAEIRRLFFEGRIVEASHRANRELGTLPTVGVDPYQPFGDLWLDFPDCREYADYRRELDLSTGTARTRFRSGNVRYEREIFVSRTDNLLVVRLTGDMPGAISGDLILSRREDPECALTFSPEERTMQGRFTEGIGFCAAVRTLHDGGSVETVKTASGELRIRISGANAVTILLAMDTSFDFGRQREQDPAVSAKAILRQALQRTAGDVGTIRRRHLQAHRKLFDRVKLRLGSSSTAHLPTDQRLSAMRAGNLDPSLQSLYFHYGRYLLMASSAPGGLPANLQGIWNEDLRPPWDADFHHDINLQMNYWHAEVTNLSECHDPLFDHVERLAKNGRQAAKDFYGCWGVYIGIVSDPWALVNKTQGGWSEWTGAAAWLAQHFWQRWEYSGDREFLSKRAYPFMKAVAAFYEDYLVPDPRPQSRWKGRLVTVPSQSPENRFAGGIDPVSLTIGATMDFQLIHELLTNCIAASKLLGADADRRAEWERILRQIPPLQIGRHGQLQEWLEDYDETEPGHRHMSHLYGLFPGEQITREKTPEFAEAARRSIERRLAHAGGHTGWSRSWLVGLFARLGDGDSAEYHLRHLITDFATMTLLDLHPPRIFQIDGNFGGTAGTAEMLLQSHAGVIRLLPALPKAWMEGEVAGLAARGGVEVGILWRDGRAVEATLKSRRGGPCRIAPPPGQKVARAVLGSRRLTFTAEKEAILLEIPAGQTARLTLE